MNVKIKLTGDTHGVGNDRIYKNRDCDYLIILGDFGYYGKSLKQLVKGFKTQVYKDTNPNCKILVVDGNHEHFPELEKTPSCEMFGGIVNELAPNMYWLRRGELYTIANTTFLVFGGAFSIDRAWRVEGKSWFSQEEYSEVEEIKLEENLKRCNYQVDYILTHDAPESICRRILYPQIPYPNRTMALLEWVYATCQFENWYFGHHHAGWSYQNFRCLCTETCEIII